MYNLKSSQYGGHDSTAIIVDNYANIFTLPKNTILRIKESFGCEYSELEHLAMKKYKNHQIIKHKEAQMYITALLADQGDSEASSERDDIGEDKIDLDKIDEQFTHQVG